MARPSSVETYASVHPDDLPVALLVLGPTGRFELANGAARRLCGLPDGLLEGRLPDLARDEDAPLVGETIADLCSQNGTRVLRFEMDGRRKTDGSRQIEARLTSRGPEGRSRTIVATLEDITARCIQEAELRRRATVDPLTGLLNRATIIEEIETRLLDGALTAIYCDLDGFKSINDTQGHASGDELLIELARLLTSMVRPTDLVGRLGGDEFVIVCDGLVEPPTTHVIARLSAAVAQRLGVRLSIGVAGAPAGSAAADLIDRADRAMYLNKRRFRPQAAGESLPPLTRHAAGMRILIGATLLLIGGVWFFQGLGTIKGYGMTGHGEWTVIGAIVVLLGVATLLGARRARNVDHD